MPHGGCYLWTQSLIALHATSDALIVLSYYSIPITLLYFVRKRKDLKFHWMFVCFAVFILACGTSHLMEIWNIWHADYWLSGAVKAVTALASVPTAFLLVRLIPQALALPAPADLQAAYDEMERRVQERTAELLQTTRNLEAEIAERKLAEEGVARLVAIVESSDDAIIGKTLDGIVTSWNAGAEKIFGYTADEMVGQSILRLIPLDRHHEEKDILNKIRHGESFRHLDTVRLRKDQHPIDVSITTSAVKDATGKIIGASKIARDITERKVAEEKIRQMNVELEQRVSERTAELEAFSYSVSHDLRAPVRAIGGFARMVQEDYGRQMPEEANRKLGRIHENAMKMGQLIDGLLAFSRLGRQSLNRCTVQPSVIVRSILDELEPEQSGRHLKILTTDLPPCQADPTLLQQVFANLISNAFKYTRQRDPAVIEIGWRDEKGKCVYFIKDNGAGFEMAYAHKLFGVFQRLHGAEQFEGTGVGLAIVQRIIQRHGGQVWAEAEPEKGATFSFTLGRENYHV